MRKEKWGRGVGGIRGKGKREGWRRISREAPSGAGCVFSFFFSLILECFIAVMLLDSYSAV